MYRLEQNLDVLSTAKIGLPAAAPTIGTLKSTVIWVDSWMLRFLSVRLMYPAFSREIIDRCTEVAICIQIVT